VAVEHRDDRRRLAGEPEEHRGDRAAVLGAVEDSGQHDDRRHRLEAQGDRQQDGDRRCRAEAGQDPDEHADDDTDQAVEKVGRFQDDGESVEHRGEVHSDAPQNRCGMGTERAATKMR
jgi:hypothetical protein